MASLPDTTLLRMADSEDEEACGAYPNTDEAFGAYPDTDEAYGAYPNTDDAYGTYPNTDEGYPDTDQQYAGAHEYPDPEGPAAPSAPTAPPPPPGPAAAPAPASRRWAPPDWCKAPLLHKPVLEAYEGGVLKRTMRLDGRKFFIFGRNGAQADIILPDGSVSRAHAAIINSSSATFVQDLDSAHGTFLDATGRVLPVPQLGEKLDPEAPPTKLEEGATLRLGSCRSVVYRVVGTEHTTLERWTPPAWASEPGRKVHFDVRLNDIANPYLAHLQVAWATRPPSPSPSPSPALAFAFAFSLALAFALAFALALSVTFSVTE